MPLIQLWRKVRTYMWRRLASTLSYVLVRVKSRLVHVCVCARTQNGRGVLVYVCVADSSRAGAVASKLRTACRQRNDASSLHSLRAFNSTVVRNAQEMDCTTIKSCIYGHMRLSCLMMMEYDVLPPSIYTRANTIFEVTFDHMLE